MDPILQTLLSWQFIIFGLAISAVVFVIRKIVEYSMTRWAKFAINASFWNELLLPILPVILGALLAIIIQHFPYPENLTTGSSRFVFGLVAGLLSTLIYRVVNSLLGQKITEVITSIKGQPPTTTTTTTTTIAPPSDEDLSANSKPTTTK